MVAARLTVGWAGDRVALGEKGILPILCAEIAAGKCPRIAFGVIDTCYTYRRDSVYVRDPFSEFLEPPVEGGRNDA